MQALQVLRRWCVNKVIALILSFSALLSVATGGFVKLPEGILPDVAQPPQAEVAVYPGAVRVASFNVQTAGEGSNFMLFRIGAVTKTIEKYAPDSFGVQEAHAGWLLAIKAALPAYDYVGISRDGYIFDEFSAIFYRSDKYDVVDSGTFWLSETPERPSIGWDAALNRICTWAVLRNKETGECYAHVNTHLDHVGEQARQNSVQLLLDKVAELGLPTVCTGDFNAAEGTAVYNEMTAVLGDSKYLAPDTMSMGTFNGFDMEGLEDKLPIDFLFVTEDTVKPMVYRVVTDLVNGRIPSDHCMIYTDVLIG